jgi:ATP-binding cassette subfamily B protein
MAYYGMFDVGALASYLIFVRQTAAPINQFVQQMTLLLSASSGLGRIFEFMDEPEETNTGVVTLAFGKEENGTWQESDTYTGKWVWRHPRSDGSMELVPLHGDVAFENVTFGYDPARPVLKDFSLKVDAGDTVALVGSTGAGKTTISNLLNRFYDIDAGTIALDGIDIRLIELGDLRRSIALVLQESKVFSRSIKDNIGYGDLNAADAEIEDAARLSFADSYISRLPRGYETMIDEKGDSLSKGQIQLLAIARAALSNPPVLILDEATSSIDTRTESLIDKGMQQLMKDRTTFVIAHRLSTIQNADRIVVLDKGRIAESGSHEELLKQKGMYYRLWTGQAELD